jgi:hypothetical protein
MARGSDDNRRHHFDLGHYHPSYLGSNAGIPPRHRQTININLFIRRFLYKGEKTNEFCKGRQSLDLSQIRDWLFRSPDHQA